MAEVNIARINELAKKNKTEGLTDAEAQELHELRQAYLEAFRHNLRAQLDSIVVVEENGERHPLKKKGSENLSLPKMQSSPGAVKRRIRARFSIPVLFSSAAERVQPVLDHIQRFLIHAVVHKNFPVFLMRGQRGERHLRTPLKRAFNIRPIPRGRQRPAFKRRAAFFIFPRKTQIRRRVRFLKKGAIFPEQALIFRKKLLLRASQPRRIGV